MERSIGIVGTGSYLPERIMTNFDLEKLVDTSDEWIRAKTGIRERRIADPEEATSDLAVKAAKKALDSAAVKGAEIDLIIVATSTPDMPMPSTACLIQHKLGLKNNCAVFDIVAICSGFPYALSIATDIMKGNRDYKTALLIGAETYSRILDWTDRTTCVFFGDGAGAVVLRDVPETYGLLSSYIASDGSGWHIINLPAGGSRLPATHETIDKRLHTFRMDGKRVWNFAIDIFPKAIRKATEKAGLNINDLDLIIPHQANINIIKIGMDALGLPMSKAFTNLEKYGNTAGASSAIALDEAAKLGKINKGDVIAILGFGGGLTWGADILRWAI